MYWRVVWRLILLVLVEHDVVDVLVVWRLILLVLVEHDVVDVLVVWRLILLVLVEHDFVDVLVVVAQAGGLAADPAGTGRARRRRCTGGGSGRRCRRTTAVRRAVCETMTPRLTPSH